jgi:hypothetical protein
MVVAQTAVEEVRSDASSSLLLRAQVDGCDLARDVSGVVVVRTAELLH